MTFTTCSNTVASDDCANATPTDTSSLTSGTETGNTMEPGVTPTMPAKGAKARRARRV